MHLQEKLSRQAHIGSWVPKLQYGKPSTVGRRRPGTRGATAFRTGGVPRGGPVRSDVWSGLRWLDMPAGGILSPAPDGTVARRHVGTVAAAVRPRRGGGAVMGPERGFSRTRTAGSPPWSPCGAPRTASVCVNEGGCDPGGRFSCGSMAHDVRHGAGSLHRLDPDGPATTVLDDVTGAPRDMIQSHLLQVVALVTMLPPSALDQLDVRDAKAQLLLRCVL
ncbi:SMP-30/gluconolactonase/LRE family protein [Streptomyces anandii]|uniref:SMP-30/gluconolactonase/LRE family protein n=1 Tax=Streptomyces anandii TaxID=285454 RepID=A0ABW6HB80_9ACTN